MKLKPEQLAEIRERLHYCDVNMSYYGIAYKLNAHITALEDEKVDNRIELCVLDKGGKVLGEYPVIWLGRGNTIVSDVCGDDWAGVVVSTTEEHVGIGEEFMGDLNPLIVIASKDPRSFEVVIGKCQTALNELLSKQEANND